MRRGPREPNAARRSWLRSGSETPEVPTAAEVATTEVAPATEVAEVRAAAVAARVTTGIARVAARVSCIAAVARVGGRVAGLLGLGRGVVAPEHHVGERRSDDDPGDHAAHAHATAHAASTPAEGALEVAGTAHLGAGRAAGEVSRLVAARALTLGKVLVEALEDHLALLGGELGEGLGVHPLDVLRRRGAQQVLVAGDGPLVLGRRASVRRRDGIRRSRGRLLGPLLLLEGLTAQELVEESHVFSFVGGASASHSSDTYPNERHGPAFRTVRAAHARSHPRTGGFVAGDAPTAYAWSREGWGQRWFSASVSTERSRDSMSSNCSGPMMSGGASWMTGSPRSSARQ